MPAPSLSTPAARIELRDLATAAFHETADGSQDNRAGVCAAASAITDLGFLVATDARPSASSFATLTVTACDGSTLTLDWDPMLDGFDYATSGDDGCDLDEIEANTEDEPECEGCDGLFPLAKGETLCETCSAAADADPFDAAEPPANSAAWCDGCEQFCAVDDVEISAAGDETFAYCKCCRAKHAATPRD